LQPERGAIAILAVGLRKVTQHSDDMSQADLTAPRHRTDRVVHAFLHGCIDVVRRRDSLVDGVGRLVHQHRDRPRHREPRHIGKHGYLLPEQDKEADRLAQVCFAGLRRRSESDAGTGRKVEREVEQHQRLANQGRPFGRGASVAEGNRMAVDADEPFPRTTLDAGLSVALQQDREPFCGTEITFDVNPARLQAVAASLLRGGSRAPSR
jgi:hypothetical protein